jgi:hypothetical protein
MMAWEWVAIGVAAFVGVSLVVGLGLARILGNITDGASRLLEEVRWASAPLTRGMGPSADRQWLRQSARHTVGLRTCATSHRELDRN